MTWGEQVPPWRPGVVYFKPTSDGREIGVYPEIPGTGKLYRGPLADDIGFDQSWRYETVQDAIDAAKAWDGESEVPPGKWVAVSPQRPDEDAHSANAYGSGNALGEEMKLNEVGDLGEVLIGSPVDVDTASAMRPTYYGSALVTVNGEHPKLPVGPWTPLMDGDEVTEVQVVGSTQKHLEIERRDEEHNTIIHIKGAVQYHIPQPGVPAMKGCRIDAIDYRVGV